MGEADDHGGEDFPEQEFMRRDARYVDLQDGFLLSFFCHRQRGEQRRKQRQIQHEDAGCIELVGGTPGVIPKSNRGVDWALLRGAGSAFVVGTGDLLRVARDKLCRIRIGSVHQHLHRRPIATRHVSAEVFGYDQRRPSGVRLECRLGMFIDRPLNDAECD